jgi:hypothetical protein
MLDYINMVYPPNFNVSIHVPTGPLSRRDPLGTGDYTDYTD